MQGPCGDEEAGGDACQVMLCCGSSGRTREWRLVSCCCRCSRDWRSLSASALAAVTAPLSCSARCLSCEREDAASAPASRQYEAPCGLPFLITGRAAVMRYPARGVGPCTGLAQGRAKEGFEETAAHLCCPALRLLQALALRALHIAQQLLVGAPDEFVAQAALGGPSSSGARIILLIPARELLLQLAHCDARPGSHLHPMATSVNRFRVESFSDAQSTTGQQCSCHAPHLRIQTPAGACAPLCLAWMPTIPCRRQMPTASR